MTKLLWCDYMNSRLAIAAILVATVASLVLADYHLTSGSASNEEESKMPKALKIQSDFSYVEQVQSGEESVTFFVVAGVVLNNLTTNVCSVNVTTTFYDSENKTIGNSPTLSTVELQIIEAGKKAPFKTYLTLDPLMSIPSGYKLSALCFETDEEPVRGVEVIDQTAGFNKDGFYIIIGEVQNNWKTRALGVKLICAYYNETDRLIALSHTPVSSAIDSGDTATFELSSKPFKVKPESYELFVIVHHYNPLPLTHYLLFFAMLGLVLIFIVYMKRVRGW